MFLLVTTPLHGQDPWTGNPPRVPTPGNTATDDRLADHLGLAALAAHYPHHLIDEVVAGTGTKEKRSRALPARVMVRFAIARSPHHGQGSDSVMRQLIGSLRSTDSWEQR